MFNLKVKSKLDYATDYDEGKVIFNELLPVMKKGEMVYVDFEGLTLITTSFVNAAFVPLLEVFEFEQIKKQLRILNTSQFTNQMIRTRMEFEANRIIPFTDGHKAPDRVLPSML